MSKNSSPSHRRLSAPSTPRDVIIGTLVQIGRKYLFINVRKKMAFYLALVIVLSLIGGYFPLPKGYYFVQKHNFLNQYGVKIGWFLDMFLIGPVYSVDVKVTLQFKHESLIESCSTGCCYLSLVFLHIIAVAFKTWQRSNFRPVYFPIKVNRKLKVGSVEARMKTVGGRQIIREECFKKNHPHPKLFHSTYQLLENMKNFK